MKEQVTLNFEGNIDEINDLKRFFAVRKTVTVVYALIKIAYAIIKWHEDGYEVQLKKGKDVRTFNIGELNTVVFDEEPMKEEVITTDSKRKFKKIEKEGVNQNGIFNV